MEYVKYFNSHNEWSINSVDWIGVDDTPTLNSKNLLESGNVAKILNDIRSLNYSSRLLGKQDVSVGYFISTDGLIKPNSSMSIVTHSVKEHNYYKLKDYYTPGVSNYPIFNWYDISGNRISYDYIVPTRTITQEETYYAQAPKNAVALKVSSMLKGRGLSVIEYYYTENNEKTFNDYKISNGAKKVNYCSYKDNNYVDSYGSYTTSNVFYVVEYNINPNKLYFLTYKCLPLSDSGLPLFVVYDSDDNCIYRNSFCVRSEDINLVNNFLYLPSSSSKLALNIIPIEILESQTNIKSLLGISDIND